MVGDQLWIIYVLVFAAALLGVQSLYWLVFRVRSEKKIINRRLALTAQLSNPDDVLQSLRRERGLALIRDVPAFERLDRLVMQTGLQLSGTRIALWLIGLTAGFYLPIGLWLGMGLSAIPLAFVAALAVGFVLLFLARSRRIDRFSEQLPEALDIVVRGLRAGHPLQVALGLVAREMPDPIGTEFGIVLDEIRFGLDQRAAANNLYTRVGQDDLSFLSTAISIQSQSGGNLADILQRLSRLLRSRARMRLKVRAMTSEGRWSGVFLSAMPFILFFVVNLLSPSYFADLKGSPFLMPAVWFGLTLLGIGNVLIYRMVHFKF